MAEEAKATQEQPPAPLMTGALVEAPADEKPTESAPAGTSDDDKNVEQASAVAPSASQVDAQQNVSKGEDALVSKGAEATEEATGAAKEAETESEADVQDHVHDVQPAADTVGKSDEQASTKDKEVNVSELAPEAPTVEPASAPQPEDTAAEASEANGVTESAVSEKAPTEVPAAEANGAEVAQAEPAAVTPEATKGGKRKAEEVEEAAAPNGDRAEKKAKTAKVTKADVAKDKANGDAAPRKPGRPKKDKTAPADAAPVGKTLRKTRSQGPA